jgi:hypothetical protein
MRLASCLLFRTQALRTSGDLARCLHTGRAADCRARDGRLLADIAAMSTLSGCVFHRYRMAVLSNMGIWRPGTWIMHRVLSLYTRSYSVL